MYCSLRKLSFSNVRKFKHILYMFKYINIETSVPENKGFGRRNLPPNF